jgi:lipoate-protein ligase B
MKLRQHGSHASVDNTGQAVMNGYLLDIGKVDYHDAHQFQLACVNYRLHEQGRADIFIVTEHPPVFTLGKRGGLGSLTVSQEYVTDQGVGIVQTERGGDITYHGPGQLVVYPIIHLRESKLSIKDYVDLLEDVMISCADDFGVTAVRDQRNRGIWVGNNKIGSIGIRVRHGVTFHGLALNVTLDFEHFGWIQPCGLAGVGVTSLAKETGGTILFHEVKDSIISHLERSFERKLVPAPSTLITGEAV